MQANPRSKVSSSSDPDDSASLRKRKRFECGYLSEPVTEVKQKREHDDAATDKNFVSADATASPIKLENDEELRAVLVRFDP